MLVAVQALELSDGFGGMADAVDPVDLAANVVGIALAVDVTARVPRRRLRATSNNPPAR